MSMKNAKGLTDFSLLRLFEILFFFFILILHYTCSVVKSLKTENTVKERSKVNTLSVMDNADAGTMDLDYKTNFTMNKITIFIVSRTV